MENKKIVNIELTGVSSGDYEAACFDVTKEEFKRLNDREPEEFEESFFFKDLFRHYGVEIPDKFISEFGDGAILKIKATFEIEKVGEATKKD